MYEYKFPAIMTDEDFNVGEEYGPTVEERELFLKTFGALHLRNYLRIAAKVLVQVEREKTGKQLWVKDVFLARALYEASCLLFEAYVGPNAPAKLPVRAIDDLDGRWFK